MPSSPDLSQVFPILSRDANVNRLTFCPADPASGIPRGISGIGNFQLGMTLRPTATRKRAKIAKSNPALDAGSRPLR